MTGFQVLGTGVWVIILNCTLNWKIHYKACHFERSEKSLGFKHLRYYVFTCWLSLIIFCCCLWIQEISRFAAN